MEDPPGSTQKILTAACALENGQEDFELDDTGEFAVGGASIHNFSNGVYGRTNLQSALQNSVNTYFAALSLRLGQRAFMETQEQFLYNVPIADLDFTEQTLTSSVSLTTQASLAMAGYGQSTLRTSPLHIALSMAGVMHDGTIVKPYLVENTTIRGKTKHQHKPETLSKDCISRANARTLRSYLNANAIGYGFDEASCGTVYAKTGRRQPREQPHLLSGCDRRLCCARQHQPYAQRFQPCPSDHEERALVCPRHAVLRRASPALKTARHPHREPAAGAVPFLFLKVRRWVPHGGV